MCQVAPLYKYAGNRVLTAIQNLLMGQKLAEYHTGYRAFSAEVLRMIPIEENSDDFVFDNQVLARVAMAGLTIGEITRPARYFEDASSINFRRSSIYGLGVLKPPRNNRNVNDRSRSPPPAPTAACRSASSSTAR